MTRRLVSGVAAGMLMAAMAGSAAGQPMKADPRGYVAGTAGCDPKNCAYVIDSWGNKDNNVVKSATYNGALGVAGNLCWRTGYWTPQMAIAQCEPDLVPKPAPPPPPPAAAPPPPPPPPPAPAPAPAPAPQVQKITLDSKVLFDFDSASLKPEGRGAIDSQVVSSLSRMQKLEVVLVSGHTDRLGTEAYNQRLSQRRADAVRDYLVGKGVDKAKIETIGMGEKQPVVQCDQKNVKQLIDCLQPNRRVDVQAKGETMK